jgi:hypothetical protein
LIDWHDFVVVETIVLDEPSAATIPPPPEPQAPPPPPSEVSQNKEREEEKEREREREREGENIPCSHLLFSLSLSFFLSSFLPFFSG